MIMRELSFRLSWFPLVVLFLFSSDITESYWHALVHPGWFPLIHILAVYRLVYNRTWY